MAENFDDFVDKVRDANPVEEVLAESGIPLRGHGRLRTAAKHDSMKVRTDMQRIFWYSQNWNGDVFAWIMREKGCDFMGALEILARRAHMEMPRFAGTVNESEVKKNRATADVFSVAANVFHRWLVGHKDENLEVPADAAALEYAKGRGWSDDTLNAALIGFSGRREAWQYKDMKGDFALYGIDPLCPAAVAVLGFEGDVDHWAELYQLKENPDFDAEWISKKRIHGLMDTPGLIYAHHYQGGVKYLSRRQLPGFDQIKSEGKTRAWKSFNPHKGLVGPKQPYWNHVHRIDRPLIGVEGQGDAVSYGQLNFGSLAFCGLLGDPSQMTPEDGERLRKLAVQINKHPAVYLHLDEDEAGQKAIRLAAMLLGPKTQIVRMSRTYTREDAAADANPVEEGADHVEE